MPGQTLPEKMKNTTPANEFAIKKQADKMETTEPIDLSTMEPTLKIAEPDTEKTHIEPTVDSPAKYPYERAFYWTRILLTPIDLLVIIID